MPTPYQARQAEEGTAQSVEGHSYAFVIHDVYTQFVGAYPSMTKSGPETLSRLRQFLSDDITDRMCSGVSREIGFACRVEGIPHDVNRLYNKQATTLHNEWFRR